MTNTPKQEPTPWNLPLSKGWDPAVIICAAFGVVGGGFIIGPILLCVGGIHFYRNRRRICEQMKGNPVKPSVLTKPVSSSIPPQTAQTHARPQPAQQPASPAPQKPKSTPTPSPAPKYTVNPTQKLTPEQIAALSVTIGGRK